MFSDVKESKSSLRKEKSCFEGKRKETCNPQSEGFAKKRGRQSSFTPEKMRELVNVACSDYYTVRELAGMFRVSRASVCRALERAETLGMQPGLSSSEILL